MSYERYRGFNFTPDGEVLDRPENAFFWISLTEECRHFGDALEIVNDSLAAVNDLFRNRRGEQMGFEVVTDETGDFAAITWQEPNTQDKHLVFLTDGTQIVTSDPGFIPDFVQEAGISMNANSSRLDDYYGRLPWVLELEKAAKKQCGQEDQNLIIQPLTAEVISETTKVVLKRGVAKRRRRCF